MRNVPETRFRGAPLRLGTPLRTPTCAWRTWGIEFKDRRDFKRLVESSEEAYSREWKSAHNARHEDISRTAQAAGLGSANQRLNERVAAVIGRLARRFDRSIRILDLGAGTGATTLSIWKRLPSSDRVRTDWTLVDPGLHSHVAALAACRTVGIPSESVAHYTGRDLDVLPDFRDSFDIVVSVAAIHHHAWLEPVFRGIADALKPGGFVVIGDWHNRLSTHPALVLSLLEQLDWSHKEEDLRRFRQTHPIALRRPRKTVRQESERADQQIIRFWVKHARSRRKPAAALVLEGHRPVEHYMRGLQQVHLRVPRHLRELHGANPCFLLPRSRLLSVLVARKPGR